MTAPSGTSGGTAALVRTRLECGTGVSATVPAPVAASPARGVPTAASPATFSGTGVVGGTRPQLLRQRGLGNFPLDEGLDSVELALLLLVDKRNGRAGRRGPGRPADAVNVVLGVVRNVEINYRADVLDVDPARHDVRSHQHVDLAVFEVEHDLFALLLLQVGVHRCDVQLHALERKSESP